MAFTTGQRVVCINDEWWWHNPVHAPSGISPVKKQILTIERIFVQLGHAYLSFDSVLGHPTGYLHSHFRPVVTKKTDISIFTAMLHKDHIFIPERV